MIFHPPTLRLHPHSMGVLPTDTELCTAFVDPHQDWIYFVLMAHVGELCRVIDYGRLSVRNDDVADAVVRTVRLIEHHAADKLGLTLLDAGWGAMRMTFDELNERGRLGTHTQLAFQQPGSIFNRHATHDAHHGWRYQGAHYTWDGDYWRTIAANRLRAFVPSITFPEFDGLNAADHSEFISHCDAVDIIESHSDPVEWGRLLGRRDDLFECLCGCLLADAIHSHE